MVAILASCSVLSVSMILISFCSIRFRKSLMSLLSGQNVSIATATLSFVFAAGPQRAWTDAIPFGALDMTPA